MSKRSNSSGSTVFSSARASLGPSSGASAALGPSAGSGSASAVGGAMASGSGSGGGNLAVGPGAEPIVIDIGTHTVKLGFAGEPRPRAVLPTTLNSEPNHFLNAHANPASWHASGYGQQVPQLDSLHGSLSGTWSNPAGPALWDLDFNRVKSERLRKEKTEYLLARLTNLLRKVFNQYLMCDPKARRVIVIENPLTPTVVKECIYSVLFKRLHVPAITPLPAPFLALLALGLPTGLLLSLGHLEATVTPIFHGALIPSSASHPASLQMQLSSNRASGARLTRRLRALLIAYAHIIVSPPPNPGTARGLTAASAIRGSSHRASQIFTLSGTPKPRTEKISAADLDVLGPDFLEQLKVKALVVGEPIAEGVESLAATLGSLSSGFRSAKSSAQTDATTSTGAESLRPPPSTPGTKSTDGDFQWGPQAFGSSAYDNALDADSEFLEALKARYMRHSSSSDGDGIAQSKTSPAVQPLTVHLPHVANQGTINRVAGLSIGATSSAANILASSTTPSQRRVLVIPAWIRERCAEILFEPRTDSAVLGAALGGHAAAEQENLDGEEDDDECSLTELILRALNEVPLPLRRHFASRIAVAGGTAQLQGLAHRLRVETVRALEALERITHFPDVHGSPAGRSPRSSSDLPNPSAASADIRGYDFDSTSASATEEEKNRLRIPGAGSSARKSGGPSRLRRTEMEDSLLADVPPLPTHELPQAWKRKYSKIGSLWRYVRVVNDHHPPNIPAKAAVDTRIVSSAAFVPTYSEAEQDAIQQAHEHDAGYNLLNPKDTDRSKPYTGVAPTLAPSLLPWIGGSLIGSLRTSTTSPLLPISAGLTGSDREHELSEARSPKALSGYGASANVIAGSSSRKSHGAPRRQSKDMQPDQYDTSVRRALHLNSSTIPDAPELPILAPPPLGNSVFLPVPTAFPGTISREQYIEDDTVRRRLGLASLGPNAMGASSHGQQIDAEAAALLGGKGSFVGVVGGLDTGAYGGLAAVSRHMRGAWAAGTAGGPTSPRKE
ncbi:hypothetical protein A4X13_0g7212 [Tilletia indica]|uniref:Actin-like ATPase domain-containing protein n=1 Tax=Tilletia indica TaxID=43049 RepID=A0A177TZ33_9BASI|nr:hypothetical protein A4X13_0g7212 [Tilletia indica]